MVIAALVTVLLLLILPNEALAWGPATHLELGRAVLSNPDMVSHAVGNIISRYPYDFLYGNISADIVVAKNLVEELKHCHNWNIGFRVLERARSDSERSFAYGYLCHLAADTVAHNHFIPEMMIRSFTTRILRHIYWELRFDALADKRVWRLPKKIVKHVRRENDRLLKSILEDTPLSFRTNRTIFSSMLTLQRIEQWHRMLDLLSNSSKWRLHKEEKEKYSNLCLEAIKELLTRGRRARCLKKDPRGKHALTTASHLRKKLKTMRRRGRNWEEAYENALKLVSV